jgi:hypothetical protein
MRPLQILLLVSWAGSAVAGIYPDDHWNFSTELTDENFDANVQEAVDGDHTLFVRWIASEG